MSSFMLAVALKTFALNGTYLKQEKRWLSLDFHTSAPQPQAEQKITDFFNTVSPSTPESCQS